MRDAISLPRCQLLHPKIREEAILAVEDAELKFPPNMAIRVAQGLRTIAEQDALYAQGRTAPGVIVTKAFGGRSFHNYGLAIDFAILHDKDGNGTFEELSWDTALDFDKNGKIDWQDVVKSFEDRGWEWGGKWRTFKDLPHVQKNFGYTWEQLLKKHQKKDFISGTYVNI